MKKLDKATKVIAKIFEVAHWIGAVSMVVGLILTLTMGEGAIIGDPGEAGTVLNSYGFELQIVDDAGALSMGAVQVFLVGGAVIMGLMAMVFRNVYLILKSTENATPFQPDNVRMVREIGIFLIAVPAVGLAASAAARLLLGVDSVEGSVNLGSAVVGLVVLCLSRIFARGMELENETEGLL